MAARRPPIYIEAEVAGRGTHVAVTGPWGTLGQPQSPDLARMNFELDLPCATLRLASYERGARVPRHRHGPPSIVYGVGGPCIEASSHQHATVRRRLTYLPAGYTHALDYVGPTQVFAIEARPKLAARLGLDSLTRAAPLPASLYNHIWTLLIRLPHKEAELDQIVAGLWENASYHLSARIPVWIPALVEMLHENWHVQPSASDLAASLGFSPQFLCRSFKRWVGVTLTQYVQAIRLDYARGLLWGSGTDVSEIASMTGFTDQSHLTRVLRRHSGKTPGAFRSDSIAPPVALRHRYPPD